MCSSDLTGVLLDVQDPLPIELASVIDKLRTEAAADSSAAT